MELKALNATCSMFELTDLSEYMSIIDYTKFRRDLVNTINSFVDKNSKGDFIYKEAEMHFTEKVDDIKAIIYNCTRLSLEKLLIKCGFVKTFEYYGNTEKTVSVLMLDVMQSKIFE